MRQGSGIITIFIIILLFFLPSGTAGEPYHSLTDLTWVTEKYPPYTYQDNGTASGLMVDMVTAITRKAGDELPRKSIRFLPWNEAYQMAVSVPGTAIFSIARTPDREDRFSWIGPIVSSDIVLYSSRSRNITITDTRELARYTIGTITDDVAVDYLEKAGIEKNTLVTSPDPYALLTALDNGTIDLFAYGDIAAEYHIRNATGKSGFYKVSGNIGTFPVYIGISRGTPGDLAETMRIAFEELKEKPPEGGMSEFDQILSSWLLENSLLQMEYLTEGYYPYTFEEDGVAKGISVDILRVICSRYGLDMPEDHIGFGTWEEVYRRTLTMNGTALLILARSPERENLFSWAGPVDKTPIVIFSMADQAERFRNMRPGKMKIGTITDDIAATSLINAGGKDIVYSDNPADLIRMLETGGIDGWAYASTPGRQRISEYAADPAAIIPVQTLETYDFYFAFNPNTSPQVVQSFQEMLEIIRTEKDEAGISMYDRILYRYLRPGYSESTITVSEVTDLVNRTAADLATDAKGTLEMINAGIPPYKSAGKPDLYAFVYDTDVNMAAHADNIRMVGNNYHNKTDVAGRPFRDEIIAGALANGTGWVDYIYSSPAESGLFWKTTRYQHVRGSDGRSYVVCAGMFRTGPESFPTGS